MTATIRRADGLFCSSVDTSDPSVILAEVEDIKAIEGPRLQVFIECRCGALFEEVDPCDMREEISLVMSCECENEQDPDMWRDEL